MTRRWSQRLLMICAVLAGIGCSGEPRVEDYVPRGIPLPPSASAPSHELDVVNIETSPDGGTLLTVSGDKIQVWNARTMAPVAVIEDIPRLEFHHDVRVANGGRYVAILSEFLELSMWESESLATTVIDARFESAPRRLVGFSADGSLFWLSSDGLVQWRDSGAENKADSVFEVATVGWGASAQPAASDQYLVWSSYPSRLSVDSAGKAQVEPVSEGRMGSLGRREFAIAGGEKADRLLVVTKSTVELVDEAAAYQRTELTGASDPIAQGSRDEVSTFAVSRDGAFLAVGWRGGGVEVWDLEKNQVIAQLFMGPRWVRKVHPKKILDLTFSNDSLFVLLPEQRLVRVDSRAWVIDKSFEL